MEVVVVADMEEVAAAAVVGHQEVVEAADGHLVVEEVMITTFQF